VDQLVAIIMGSKADLPFAEKIGEGLSRWDVPFELRVASAHKAPRYLLDIVEKYDVSGAQIVYIAVAGRSNALGGLLDANTLAPVINCPPYSERYAGADVFSSLRMPSGVGCVTVVEPESASLAAAKILALGNSEVRSKLESYRSSLVDAIREADEDLGGKGSV
jgi:5-(carboxyamino)imidazole ribonucleotide mutase